tara:strand:+ start:587 stop:871 length:285 start_codon:yes stop_codon:yes gene_type:complete
MVSFEKLYKSLVVSGALLVSSCATTGDAGKSEASASPEPAPVTAAAPPEAEAALNCEVVCDGQGREATCPDPNNDDISNCCWLMGPELHPCCES